MLTNAIIQNVILQKLGIPTNAEIKIRTLWKHLFEMGYRPNMVRFMGALAVRYPQIPRLTDEDLSVILGSEHPDLAETSIMVTSTNLVQKGHDPEDVVTKGKYVLETLGKYFIRERQEWSEKTEILFTLALSEE